MSLLTNSADPASSLSSLNVESLNCQVRSSVSARNCEADTTVTSTMSFSPSFDGFEPSRSWASAITERQLKHGASECFIGSSETRNAYELLVQTAGQMPKAPCLGWRTSADKSGSAYFLPESSFAPPFKWWSYQTVLRNVAKLGAGLVKRFKLCPGDRVALCAKNCPWWTVALLACISQGLIVVPLHASVEPAFVEKACNDTSVYVLIASPEHARKLARAVPRCWNLRGLVVMDYGVSSMASMEADSAISQSPEYMALSAMTVELVVGAGAMALSSNSPMPGSWNSVCCILYTGRAGERSCGVSLTVG